MSTDENGDIVETFLTDVFGNLYYRDARADAAYHSKGYTSHTFDSESGLTYAHARYLDTSVHSFLSADPMQYNLTKEALYDPQSLNGYAYARNNPVLFKDPDGKVYAEVSASVTWGYVSGSFGIRGNADGLDVTVSIGGGFGMEGGLEFAYSPSGELLKESDSQFSVSTAVKYAEVLGLKLGARSEINEKAPLRMGDDMKPEVDVILGGGSSATRDYTMTIPVLRAKNKKLEPSYMSPKFMNEAARSGTVLNGATRSQNGEFMAGIMQRFIGVLKQMITLRSQQSAITSQPKNKKP